MCRPLAGLGLVLSYLAGRKRGLRSFLRGAAWSLLPIAAYLTGSIEMFWKIGSAIGAFATAFVFDPAGLVGDRGSRAGRGAVRRERRAPPRRARVGRQGKDSVAKTAGGQPSLDAGRGSTATTVAVPATRQQAAQPAAASGAGGDGKAKKTKGAATHEDDDMKEIEEILRNRGIH